jgi:hypothetical protein
MSLPALVLVSAFSRAFFWDAAVMWSIVRRRYARLLWWYGGPAFASEKV